jgi:hypothetical protein
MAGILKKLPPKSKPSADGDLSPFCSVDRQRIETGAITPIISNYVTAALLNVEPAQLAEAWADDIGSPLPDSDKRDLARVAQFYSVHLKGPVEAKRQYLKSLKGYLVAAVEDDPDADPDLVAEFMSEKRRESITFSEMARQFGYPCYREAICNPLRLLAELPLSIYLTTCHHEFLEHALIQTGHKQPVSEIFYWYDGLGKIPSIFTDEPTYVPSVQRPLVYHLFGRDDWPESLVLTEDDHLDYLVKLATLSHEVKHSEKTMDIPDSVSMTLTSTVLLLLGYSVYDWDFRVLFKGLVQSTSDSRRKFLPSISVQVVPEMNHNADEQKEIQAYLSQYFAEANFRVYWGSMQDCVYRLWQLWKGEAIYEHA